MTFPNGNHRATVSSPSPQSLRGGYDGSSLETARPVADPRRNPIRAGIQAALWNEVDRDRNNPYLGVAFEAMEQAELVVLAAAAMARLERIELDAAA